jgi:hypothetical protein
MIFIKTSDLTSIYARQVVSRKGGAEERLPLLSLFHSDCVGAIYESARRALQAPHAATQYEFTKTLALIVMQLALQLCQLSSKLDGVQLPDNFQVLIMSLLLGSNNCIFTV